MSEHPKISICIPTTRKNDCLKDCLDSIRAQTFQDYEVIIDDSRGPLSRIRNELASKATGKYIAFIDDDVTVHSGWLDGILQAFRRSSTIAGCSGPSHILAYAKKQRDIFKYKFPKWCYDQFFCDGRQFLPGHFRKSGAWTTGASEQSCLYEGEVDFLEACNMVVRRDIFNDLGGFDEEYLGVGDWSEPDLSFRIRKLGYRLWFSPSIQCTHHVSRSGGFSKRTTDSRNRMTNYEMFAERWIEPSFKHSLYKLFMRTYYAYKTA